MYVYKLHIQLRTEDHRSEVKDVFLDERSVIQTVVTLHNEAVREAATSCPRHLQVTFDLLILKEVSESCVTWATSVPILVL